VRVGEPRQGCTGGRVDAALRIFVFSKRELVKNTRMRRNRASTMSRSIMANKDQFNEPERFHIECMYIATSTVRLK